MNYAGKVVIPSLLYIDTISRTSPPHQSQIKCRSILAFGAHRSVLQREERGRGKNRECQEGRGDGMNCIVAKWRDRGSKGKFDRY